MIAKIPKPGGAATQNLKIPLLVGVLDVSVSFSYLFIIPVTAWYGVTLTLKLILLMLVGLKSGGSARRHVLFLVLLSLMLLVSTYYSGASSAVFLATSGFVAHLFLTLLLIDRGRLSPYLIGAAITGGVTAIVYIMVVAGGGVIAAAGRYPFFGGSHPNIGSEILAVTAVVGAMVLRYPGFALLVVVSIVAANLMQGRGGQLVIAMVFALRTYAEFVSNSVALKIAVAIGAVISVVLLLLIGWQDSPLAIGIRHVLLLEDEYRGGGSDLVGRGELWAKAWRYFLESPIFGKGVGYYEVIGGGAAHSFFMYGLVELGMLFIPVLLYLIFCWKNLDFGVKHAGILLSPIIILLIFNDRFLNLNPYPFLVLVVLLAGSRKGVGAN